MLTKKRLLEKISSKFGIKHLYTTSDVDLNKKELMLILNLERSEKPDIITGERPERKKRPSEGITFYREQMSSYIFSNTGIHVPPRSTIVARFYDDVADFLGL
jgi:hypothetical protein